MKIAQLVHLFRLNLKHISFLIIAVAFLSATFGIFHAQSTNQTLGLALMLLLLALFSDLKSFNFWGLVGERAEKEIKELEGKSGIDETAVPKPKTKDVLKAETIESEKPAQLMDTQKGNFLAIAFELERLMRIAASVLLGPDFVPTTKTDTVVRILKEKGLLTEIGIKQVESVRWIRNTIVHGKDNEVNDATVASGTQIAWGLYAELNKWLRNPR